MKHYKLATLLAATLAVFAVSCKKDIVQKPLYPTNTGEEYIEVTVDSLNFLGRGGSLSFSVSASYDVTITADEWITMSTLSVPGDAREYVVTASTLPNKGEGAQARVGYIYVNTANMSWPIVVTQPFYNRPDIPNPIKTAEDFKFFIEEGAPYIESGEVVSLDSDIDMKDVTISKSAEYFNGVLNGNGCTIRNLVSDKPLFLKLNEGASINELKIEGSYEIVSANEEIYFAPFVGKNDGTISGCENGASITVTGNSTQKVYAGGIVAWGNEGSTVKNCINRGTIKYAPESSTANPYIGGIVAYSYGNVDYNQNYGPIIGEPGAFSAQYHIGGITSRQEHGSLTNNINHKEANISVNDVYSSSSKSYVGGIVGRIEGTPLPATGYNETYADIYFAPKKESYVGALQGWQAKVEIGASTITTLFEGSIVNSNISAYTKGKGQYGNNPCLSAGFVTGRFSGQSGKETLHYGNEDKPIKVSGSITSLETGVKVVASGSDYQALLDGDGSKSSVNTGAVPEADYNTIKYEVVGDGQTGPAEELIVTTEDVRVEVPMSGGKTSFIFKANYNATLQTEDDWLSFSESEAVMEKVIPVSTAEQTVEIFAAENTRTVDREGKVSIKLPMGTYKEVVVFQPGNKALPAEISVEGTELEALPEGSNVTFKVTSNYDAAIATECDWITIKQATVKGDYTAQTVTLSVAANDAAEAEDRTGTVTVTVKDKVETVTVSQKKFTFTPKEEISSVKDFTDFMKYGGNADLYPAGFNVKLTTDIDLKGVAIETIPTFVANFDGQGHSLKNWACEGPLFGKINGDVVKGIVIDSSCDIKLKFENAVANGSNYCIGVICGDVLKGSIEDCTNNAAVTLATFGASPTFVGVMAGRTTASSMVKGCVNNGSVTVKPTSAVSASYRIGGMVGGSNGNVQGCRNNGPVEFSPADITGGNHFLGGIVAYLAKNADQVCADCVNTQKGKVTFNPTTITSIAQSYVGGCVGYLDGQLKADTNFSNDKNFGDVYSSANNELVAVGGLLGWAKSGGNPNNFLWNSVVNCNVTAGFASADGSAVNPCQSAGLVIGRVALSGGAANVTAVCGSEEQPVKVSGSITLLNGKSVTATEANYLDLVKGSGFADTNNKFKFFGKYEVVTKE